MSIRRQSRLKQLATWLSACIPSPVHRFARTIVGYILRVLFRIRVLNQRPSGSPLGFILPTTVLLLLVVSLAVGSISLRTFNRTQQTAGARQQRVIYNAATPVLDRAKAKIDHLMGGDGAGHPRLSTGIPSEDDLVQMMHNEPGSPFRHDATVVGGAPININNDIYTFDDEERLDIGELSDTTLSRDDDLDNAWRFEADTDGDGNNDSYVVYSIIFNTPQDLNDLNDSTDGAVNDRAKVLEVRHGPKSLIQSTERCPAAAASGIEDGWFSDEISSAFLRKNFQVDAVVIPGIVENGTLVGPDPNATVVTLEFNQDRTFDRGNKWGAWFRNDLEAFPGEAFRWNGAMHTDGSFVVGKAQFSAYLISSEFSCFNVPGASEISIGEAGQVVVGRVDTENPNFFRAPIHLYTDYGEVPTQDLELTTDTDSVDNETRPDISGGLILDPVKLFTQNVALLRDGGNGVVKSLPEDWNDNVDNPLRERISLGEKETLSDKVDQTYRNQHWEEKAAGEGVRVIVGQRLELEEPLDHWTDDSCDENSNNVGRCHETRQRRTLADKLAAVQATAIYPVGATAPAACVATTVHPGTSETLKRVASFHDFNADIGNVMLDPDGNEYLAINDFFNGRGTNGWEFEPPTASPAMDVALKNLAHFAGDPEGGAPYVAATQDDFVHPYPAMAMWGDFSILREVVDTGDTSIAGQSTRDTASCLLGMLAYNISYLNAMDISATSTFAPNLTAIGARLTEIANGVNLPPTVAALAVAPGDPPQAFMQALEVWLVDEDNGNAPFALVTAEQVEIARMVMTREQVRRDRDYGFDDGGITADGARPTCPAVLGVFLGLENFCSDIARFPALYAIFPGDTNKDGIEANEDPPESAATRGETLIAPDLVDLAGGDYLMTAAVNEFIRYEALTDTQIAEIAIAPRDMDDWVLPHAAATGGDVGTSAPNSDEDVLIQCDDTLVGICDAADVSVAFKDAGMMDGRQLMNVRVLDMNMDLFRQMLPAEQAAIIYAFREDTVREDSIVRPKSLAATAAACTTRDADVQTAACFMNAGDVNVFESIDPPLAANGQSIKPVDYYADPDRRPYGFRLRNGEELGRSNTANVDESLSFVSDNPVYIMGDFNLHQNAAGTRLEEFRGGDLLNTANYNNFYGRGQNPNLVDADFGTSANDRWRPTEVLADGVTILSNDFCDGSLRDLFDFSKGGVGGLTALDTKYGCDTSFTSYTNFPRLDQSNAVDWQLENPFDENSPVAISPNGNPLIDVGGIPEDYSGTYWNIDRNRKDSIIEPTEETTVNAVMYSASVPSRLNQSYGGLHNFPRLLEDWNRDDDPETLSISGAFFQLGFSTSATAPYDQEIWEPTAAPPADPTATHEYYDPAFRSWGYDVALQKNPPASVAKEFISNSALVSEFYAEPPIDDPYMAQLCQQIDDAVCPVVP